MNKLGGRFFLVLLGLSCWDSSGAFTDARLKAEWDGIRNRYHATTVNADGSIEDSRFIAGLADYLWQKRLSMSCREALGEFLSCHLYTSDTPGKITIVRAGQKAGNELTPIDRQSLAGAMRNSTLTSEVIQALVPEAWSGFPWNNESTVEQCVGERAVRELGNDEEIRGLLAVWTTKGDFFPLVLKHLCDIKAVAGAEDWSELKNLAVAIALVDDQKYPQKFPHGQVAPSDLPGPAMTPTEKFLDLADARKKGQLAVDISKLDVGECMFLVDHRISRDEMLWARANRPPVDADRIAEFSYRAVKYAHTRVESGRLTWLGVPYTLSNILALGGICVDQAYFAETMCKALGIPSMVFTGTGDAGGHAWVGFLTRGGKWNAEVGRSAGKYLTGKTYSPQGWETDSDHLLTAAGAGIPATARMELVMADLFYDNGDLVRAENATKGALCLAPGDQTVWRRRIAQLENGDPYTMVGELRRAVAGYRMSNDTKATLELAIARAERGSGHTGVAESIERKVIDSNIRERGDLSVEAAAAKIDGLLGEGMDERAIGEYRRFIQKVPEGSRGDFFYKVTRPLAMCLLERGDKGKGLGVVRFAKNHMPMEPGSLLAADVELLEKNLKNAKLKVGAGQ